MSWRKKRAALVFPGSEVFHLAKELVDDALPLDELPWCICGTDWVCDPYRCSVREAIADGLRLCKKCAARKDEIFARLLDVDSELEKGVETDG